MSERKRRVLIVDDDRSIHLATKYILREKFECLSAYNGDEAKITLGGQPVDVVLLDLHMRYENEGLNVLAQIKENDPDLDVIIVSSSTDVEIAARACKGGAAAYLVKEHSAEQLFITIESVLSRRELVRENQHHARDRSRQLDKNRIIGTSSAVQQLMRDIDKVRRSKANVIILGETGTGKELVARHLGIAGSQPFVAVDSSTITNTMAESILFGHERGAFTGAVAQSKGLFEEADGGTIYFDEIVNMPLEIQSKLLRVIEEKEVTRLGSTRPIPLDFRVVCATNKDLEKLIAEGRFKEDLFQRLSVITLRIPSLRERREDIPSLIEHFFAKFRYEASAKRMSDAAMELLVRYSWPGNIRELSNVVANVCAMVVCKDVVEVEDLPVKIQESARAATPMQCLVKSAQPESSDVPVDANVDFYQYMHQLEGKALRDLLRSYDGNILKMSKSIRMSRSHLYAKLRSHGLHA